MKNIRPVSLVAVHTHTHTHTGEFNEITNNIDGIKNTLNIKNVSCIIELNKLII